MTANQRDVLLALNFRQMQRAHDTSLQEEGIPTALIAATCGRTTRSTAGLLANMRDAHGWVASTHVREAFGWLLLRRGVEALEADRAATTAEPATVSA